MPEIELWNGASMAVTNKRRLAAWRGCLGHNRLKYGS